MSADKSREHVARDRLMAWYLTPSGRRIELRRNAHGYYTLCRDELGTTAVVVDERSALEHYQYARQVGRVNGWAP